MLKTKIEQVSKILKIVSFLLLCMCTVSLYARTARVYGYVVDQENVGIELANVAAWKIQNSQFTIHNSQ